MIEQGTWADNSRYLLTSEMSNTLVGVNYSKLLLPLEFPLSTNFTIFTPTAPNFFHVLTWCRVFDALGAASEKLTTHATWSHLLAQPLVLAAFFNQVDILERVDQERDFNGY